MLSRMREWVGAFFRFKLGPETREKVYLHPLPRFQYGIVANAPERAPEWRNWQTQWTQNPPMATSCEFESRLGHHSNSEDPSDGVLSCRRRTRVSARSVKQTGLRPVCSGAWRGREPEPGISRSESPSSLASGILSLCERALEISCVRSSWSHVCCVNIHIALYVQ